jgi:hypothetical protein
VPDVFLRLWISARQRIVQLGEQGQSTAEYALVMIAVAAIAGLVLTWATKTNMISKLFNTVIDKIIPG